MTIDEPNAAVHSQAENRGSVSYEFNDADLIDAPVTARMLEQLKQRVPNRLRAAQPQEPPKVSNRAALADCLLAQARVLLALGRFAEAVPVATEALSLYETADRPAELADCYHVAAKLHEALGEWERALGFLHREAELRRRFAA